MKAILLTIMLLALLGLGVIILIARKSGGQVSRHGMQWKRVIRNKKSIWDPPVN